MTLAASKGGVYKRPNDLQGYNVPTVHLWRELGSKCISGRELFKILSSAARFRQVELGIGNTCGLKCRHCFLGYESGPMAESLVPMPKLLEVVQELAEDFQTQIFCITDRDALTPGRSVPLFEHLSSLRNFFNIKFGGITNGIGLHNYISDLERIKPDFLDISLDGLRNEHDAIRGAGTFDRTLANLRIALKHNVADRIFVSTTLTRMNIESIIEMILKMIIDEGIQWIDIAPLLAVKMQTYQIRPNDATSFLDKLRLELSKLRVAHSVTILFEICEYCSSLIPELINTGWIVPEDIRQDAFGHLYQDIPINESVTLTMRPELIPEHWRHSIRISADGFVVGGCEPLIDSEYPKIAIGNIMNESLSVLYNKALSVNSPFYNAMLGYDLSGCRNKTCFRHCLGGNYELATTRPDYHNCVEFNSGPTDFENLKEVELEHA